MNIADITTKTTATLTPGDRVYVDGQLGEVIAVLAGRSKTVGNRTLAASEVITSISSGLFLTIAKWTVMPATYVEV